MTEAQASPTAVPVAVLLRRGPPRNRWQTASFQVLGIVVTTEPAAAPACQTIRNGPEGEDTLWTGFTLRLYKDETESYYHNLLAPTPHLYVLTRNTAGGVPEPFLVSASYDEANAYEGDCQTYPVALPPELYGWIEQFVLEHHRPEQRHKRQRRNWKEESP